MFGRKKKYTDREIVALLRIGRSDEVLKHLYDKVRPKVKHWILRNSGSVEEAQDVFQDAVINFYNYVLDDLFDTSKSIDGFIFTTARNLWINRAKQQSRYTSTMPLHLSAEENEGVEEKNIETRINDLLAQLGKSCSELLTYSIFYKMSMEDIASRMGLANANTAKTKNYKCKQRLVLLVKDKEGLKEYLSNG